MFNPVRSRRGMAVAPHALASQSALAVLREGGNAIEAMVAAAATIAAAYPHMNGIGGDSFWLISLPGAGGAGTPEVVGIDASGCAHGNARAEDYAGARTIGFRGGKAAITVAGTLSGWQMALELSASRLGGRMPLPRLLADAIDAARNGVPVTASQHRSTAAKCAELQGISGFADTFLWEGAPPPMGALFKQPRLAATLEHIARAGIEDFYRGDLARSMARDLALAGSPLTLGDLQAHQAVVRQPLMLEHGAGRVYNMPPPTQGLVSLMILGLMERLNLGMDDHLGADFIHGAVESVKAAFAVRDAHITDPAHMKVDPSDFLKPQTLDAMAEAIDRERASPWGKGQGPADTVWMGAIDGNGCAVSMIQSIYHEFGSGVVLQESGVNWQNRGASFSLDPAHINVLAPGKRPFHTLNPALAHLRDGRTMVYGNMGGDGQPQSQSAVFYRAVACGLNTQDAIAAPRWLLGRTWGQGSDSLKLESRFPPTTVEALRGKGHTVDVLGDYDEAFGHAGCVFRHPDGSLEGGFDPRSDGAVAGF